MLREGDALFRREAQRRSLSEDHEILHDGDEKARPDADSDAKSDQPE